ncbi:hypothetical protein PAXRUDRAFT_176199 [Paxillus rubicundulus Ve08.2h10]|uniref:Uncharacterized protein n=1 Tax=Paxillus rubicundulus Ve08.2h10 TaxID=930991 RepID=A0A0D0D2W1_9AGAM|nr:hypothetical protein PAXRUDRAFT_176199 [Paxillus rubicundulus Ve08.2h10]
MSMEQATSMPCPPDSPWALTDLIMEYMHRRFHAELFPTTDPTGILPDINIPTKMVCEADQMSEILTRAHRNPHIPPTTSQVILSDFDLGTEAHCTSAFLCNVALDGENSCDPSLAGYTYLSEPTILIMGSGEVIVWYLPAAVSQYNQVGFILEDVAD